MCASLPLTLAYVADASSIHTRRLLSFFSNRGHKVYCLTDKRDASEIPGVSIIHLPNRDSLLQAGAKANKTAVLKARTDAIRNFLKTTQPDILHALFLYQRGWSAASSGFHPLVTTLMGSDIYLPKQHYRSRLHFWRDELFNRLALQQADVITGVSPDLCRRAKHMFIGSKPVDFIPFGIEPEIFDVLPENPTLYQERLRQKYHLPASAFIIYSPRQMTPLYNIATIIEAAPRVLAALPEAFFLLKNTGPDTPERKQYVQSLETLAERLNVSHAIRWVEKTPYEDLPEYYHLSDVVVSMPETDGLPVTFFEAMACRKPLIVGDLHAYEGFIDHLKTGLRVPLHQPAALAEAIIMLAHSPEHRNTLTSAAFSIYRKYGIFAEQMQKIEDHYYALLEGKRRKMPFSISLGLFRFLSRYA